MSETDVAGGAKQSFHAQATAEVPHHAPDVHLSKPHVGAIAAAGALQVSKALGEDDAGIATNRLSVLLAQFNRARLATLPSAPNPGVEASVIDAADALCAWMEQQSLSGLQRAIAGLDPDTHQVLPILAAWASNRFDARRLAGRLFLAVSEPFRSQHMGVDWLQRSSFQWIQLADEVAAFRAAMQSSPPLAKVMLKLHLDERLQTLLAQTGEVPSLIEAPAAELATTDAFSVRESIALGFSPDDNSFTPASARKRWLGLPPSTRRGLLAGAWPTVKAGEIPTYFSQDIYLLLIADPAERAPFLSNFVGSLIENPSTLIALAPAAAPLFRPLRDELSAPARERFEDIVLATAPFIATALGLDVAAHRWPVVGKVAPPAIKHDHGHLDDGEGNIDESKRRAPTEEDHKQRNFWLLKLMGAKLLRRDLVDATRAYQHFLEGTGTDLEFSYDKYVADDAAGAATLESVLAEAREAAVHHSDQRGGIAERFTTQMKQIAANSTNPRAPYPKTENWQKAIGAHMLWAWADVVVENKGPGGERTFTLDVHLICEDRYNFNPGAADIATETPDSANGVFEMTGLAKEFMSRASLRRQITFVVPARSEEPAAVAAADDAAAPKVEPAIEPPPSGEPPKSQ